MSLTARLNCYFLACLGALLAFVTLGTYLASELVGRRLLEHRLRAAVETLAATVEVKPSGLEWEPQERRIRIGLEDDDDAIRWRLDDGGGNLLAVSANFAPGFDGPNWAVRELSIDAPEPKQRPGLKEYDRLIFTAAAKRRRIDEAVFAATAAAAGISIALWLAAAVGGRSVCRRALRPVAQMATAAETMAPERPGERLPKLVTGDELARLSDSFNGLLDRLEGAIETQRRFAGDASHQLRTPLATMIGQAEVALRRVRTPEEYRLAFELVLASSRHLHSVVETLLALTRPLDEGLSVQSRRISPSEWLAAQRHRFATHARAADFQFEPVGTAPFTTHPSLLATILDNFLDNAAKYSEPGTPIVIRLGGEGEFPVLEVLDRGIGIDVAEARDVFEPFFRSRAARSRGISGTGLGLAVAAQCAAALGLTIDHQPNLGGGSVFRISRRSLDREEASRSGGSSLD